MACVPSEDSVMDNKWNPILRQAEAGATKMANKTSANSLSGVSLSI